MHAGLEIYKQLFTYNLGKDMSAGLQVIGWPAHDSAISSVLFGPDETSIFSLGTDGKASTSSISIDFGLKLCYASELHLWNWRERCTSFVVAFYVKLTFWKN